MQQFYQNEILENIKLSDLIRLKFHHIGLLVDNISEAIHNYSVLFGKENISEVFNLHSQKVKECFIKISENVFLGLVEPITEDSVVYKLLKKKISYYHIAYKVPNLIESIKILENQNYKSLEMFKSEAFDNKYCAFLYTPDGHLFELIEE